MKTLQTLARRIALLRNQHQWEQTPPITLSTLKRGGYNFWLEVLTTHDAGNYRGMVCSFITSAEYQHRFSPVVVNSNAECGP